MLTFETEYRVCYGDTDMMGVVYYGNYPRLYEIGRNDMIRSVWKSYREIEREGYMLPAHSLEVSYHKPARYEDILTIKTIINEVPKVKFTIKTQIYNQEGELINEGKVVLAFMDKTTRRPCRAPEELVRIIEASLVNSQ